MSPWLNVAVKMAINVLMKYLNYPRLKSRVRNVCALVVASLILPALAHADHDNDKDSYRGNHWRGDNDEHHGDPRISAVPEVNAGIVLIPFVGAVLLFSSLQLLRRKTQRNGSHS